jgi:hypothetical protein
VLPAAPLKSSHDMRSDASDDDDSGTVLAAEEEGDSFGAAAAPRAVVVVVAGAIVDPRIGAEKEKVGVPFTPAAAEVAAAPATDGEKEGGTRKAVASVEDGRPRGPNAAARKIDAT